jgi:hypothetical protein
MEERLLAALIVAPFVISMAGFAVAIAFAPAVPNEIAPATDHDHEEHNLKPPPSVSTTLISNQSNAEVISEHMR